MTRAPRATFVYPNPRLELARQAAHGDAPDTALLGQNHLGRLGIEARIHESRVRSRTRERGLRHRVTWLARELVLPWELGDTDVVVTPLATLLPLTALLRRRPRVIVFDWGLVGQLRRASSSRRSLLLRGLRSAAAILSPSPSMRDRLLGETTLEPGRVYVVELGADAAWFVPGEGSRDDTVLAVGKDMARDYRTFGTAMRLVGGEATVVAEPRNLVGLDLPANVIVRRGLPWLELRRLYGVAGCVVIALRHESAGVGSDGSGLTALLEAMAMGAPIVATRRPAIADYVEDGRSALLVPAEEPEALAGAIRKIRDDPALRRSLGRAAREAVEQRLSTRHLADRLVPIIRAHASRGSTLSACGRS